MKWDWDFIREEAGLIIIGILMVIGLGFGASWLFNHGHYILGALAIGLIFKIIR